MNFDAYDLDTAIYDEMFLSDGTPREHCRALHDALRRLSDGELQDIQDRVTRSFSNEGITFTVYGDDEADERVIPIDCVPRILSGAEWRQLEAGLMQRIGALNRFLEDVYGEARIIADGGWCAAVPSTASRCAGSPYPMAPGSPSAAPTWCAPMTDSRSSRTTCGCRRACPT